MDSSRRRRIPGPTKSTTGRARPPTRSSDSATLCGPTTDNTRFDKGSGYSTSASALFTRLCGRRYSCIRTAAFAKYVVNNWQLSSITTLQSGRPTGSLTIHLNDTPVTGMLYSADALDGFNGNFRVPFLPVNSLYTPWVQQENFRLTKNIPLPREKHAAWASSSRRSISPTTGRRRP